MCVLLVDPVKRMESVASFFGKDIGELGASYHSPVHESGDLSKVQSSIRESSTIDDMIRDLRRKNVHPRHGLYNDVDLLKLIIRHSIC
jgi:hypothetical protein